jgi:23S rRNA pseudouridine1911/1915/1917 synthase
MPPDDGNSIHDVPFTAEGLRIDQYAALICPDHSRSFLADLIRKGCIRIDGRPVKPSAKVRAGSRVSVHVPDPEPPAAAPEAMALDILFEDDQLIVLNKDAGVVVHPGPGHAGGTLVNGLLHHCRDLSPIGGALRPGIVHRLDRGTSGTMVVAKSAAAHEGLSAQFQDRTVAKTYLALVWGHFQEASGRIDHPIGRHPTARKKMSVRGDSGRCAETLWSVRKAYPKGTLLTVGLKTGRTHQIRVHCAAEGHPIVGDPVYGRRGNPARDSRDPAAKRLLQVSRQMLHAWRLAFVHPTSGQPLAFQSPLPPDMVLALHWMAALGA